MIRQFCYIYNFGNRFSLFDNLSELDAILIVHPNRRSSFFIAVQMFIVQSAISSQFHHVRQFHHQVHHADVLFDDLFLKAMFLVAGFSIFIELPQIIFFEGNFHKLLLFWGQRYKQFFVFTNLRTHFCHFPVKTVNSQLSTKYR